MNGASLVHVACSDNQANETWAVMCKINPILGPVSIMLALSDPTLRPRVDQAYGQPTFKTLHFT